MRWFTGDPNRACCTTRPAARDVAHPRSWRSLRARGDPARRGPRARAAALARARHGTVNVLMLLPLVTPEIVMGARCCSCSCSSSAPSAGDAGPGHRPGDVLALLRRVIVRGRLASIGPEYEEAAADLGAPPRGCCWRVLLPLLAPAIVAGLRSCSRCRSTTSSSPSTCRRTPARDRLDLAVLARPRRADAGAERAGHGRAPHHAG